MCNIWLESLNKVQLTDFLLHTPVNNFSFCKKESSGFDFFHSCSEVALRYISKIILLNGEIKKQEFWFLLSSVIFSKLCFLFYHFEYMVPIFGILNVSDSCWLYNFRRSVSLGCVIPFLVFKKGILKCNSRLHNCRQRRITIKVTWESF